MRKEFLKQTKTPWPVAEFEDTPHGFKFRLVLGEETSKWCQDYRLVLTHRFNDRRLFGLCTQYWLTKDKHSLPVEKPFLITTE